MTLRRRYFRIRRWLRRRGPRLHLSPRYCELHGRRVWLTTRATRSKRHAVFCSPDCKAARANPARRRHALEEKAAADALVPQRCPRPDKQAYPSEEACRAAFVHLLTADPGLGVYQCRCLSWHAGHSDGIRRTPPPLTAPLEEFIDPDVAARLRELAGGDR